MKDQKVNYCLGFSACFIVVMVVSLLVTIVNNTPVVFLRLAELNQGEIDIIAVATNSSYTPKLNYTLISSNLANEDPTFVYNSPRMVIGASALAVSDCAVAGLDPFNG